MASLFANLTAKRAITLHTAKMEDKAFPLYEKAYAQGCTDAFALSAYGLLLIRKGEAQKAVEVLKTATKLKLTPEKWLYVYQNLGLAYWKAGNLDRAVKVFSRIYERAQTSTVRGSYGFLLIAKGDETGDYDEALRFNIAAVEYDDEDPVLLDNLGQVLYRVGRLEDATKRFEDALKLRETQFDSLYYLARCYVDQGREDDAKPLLEKALAKKTSALNTVERADVEAFAQKLGMTIPAPAPEE